MTQGGPSLHTAPGNATISRVETTGEELKPKRSHNCLISLSKDRMVAGVAGGMAEVLGIPAIYVRAGFCALSLLWGLGLILYLVVWGFSANSGLEQDYPLITRLPSSETLWMRTTGLGIAFGGILFMLRGVIPWPGDRLVWPMVFVLFGGAVLADRSDSDPKVMAASLFDPSGRWVRTRVLLGGALFLGGLALLFSTKLDALMLAVLVTSAGAVLIFGPWLRQLAKALSEEHRERIRQEERADMAAHLHDSVLQTLALIQRSDDPQKIVTLARAQERELRSWLFDDVGRPIGDSFAKSLAEMAARVEEDFTIPVEVVSVGDVALDERTQALLLAAGEAMVNAANHSGADRVTVYSEKSAERLEVWVSDQGRGFDVESVKEDRHGISESILGRMSRQDGCAEITSRLGEGTEVHLTLPMKE